MKRVRINEGKVGLVYRKGNYNRVITEGNYWIKLAESVVIHDRAYEFETGNALDLLLKDAELADELIVVEVLDNQIALKYENKVFQKVLTPGRYVFWKGVKTYHFEVMQLDETEIVTKVNKNMLSKGQLLPYVRMFEILSHEKAVLYVDGVYKSILSSGTYHFWRNATPLTVMKADMRMKQMEVSGQEILTKDKAGLRVNFQVLFKVTDIEKALIDHSDYEKQLYTLVQLILREFISSFTLDELLEKKEEIGEFVKETLKPKTKILGVAISEAGVRDIILPGEMKEIMNQVLIAQKQAQANVIMRREETASTRSLLNTAKLMEDNDMLFRLKEMEYVEKIAEKVGEITLGGNGQMIEQLKGLFSVSK